MENKKIELGVFGAENRKRAADFLNKTTNKVKTALDQNDDGELNLVSTEQIPIFAAAIKSAKSAQTGAKGYAGFYADSTLQSTWQA